MTEMAMTTCRQIGIDVREWESGTSTGIARVLTGFTSWAAAHTPHHFVLLGNQHTEFRVSGDSIVAHVEPEKNRLVWDQVKLPRLLARYGVEVLLSPYYKGPLRAPCPVVVTANDLIELHYPAGPWPKRRARATWMRLMLKRACRVLTLSEFSRRDLVETLGVAAARISVVPVGIDEQFLRTTSLDEEERIRRRLNLPPRYLLYVGRCTSHKNVSTLVRAWSAMPTALRDSFPLVLAGSDDDAFRTLTKASKAQAITPGFVDDADLAALYRGATVMCFPSLYEGFGLPPLEAMACGTPVVASNAASIPEVLGDAAVLVDPADVAAWSTTLVRVLEDDALRRRLAARGKVRAGEYTRERSAGLMLEGLLVAAGENTDEQRPAVIRRAS